MTLKRNIIFTGIMGLVLSHLLAFLINFSTELLGGEPEPYLSQVVWYTPVGFGIALYGLYERLKDKSK